MLFDIDAAAISLVFDGASSGTFGSSSTAARIYDELQFTFGEGPCLDSVARRTPISVVDLADPKEVRWPAFGPALLAHEIRGVLAVPVVVAGEYVGALDLFRRRPGRLEGEQFAGTIVAAEIAGVPLLDLIDADLQAAVSDPNSNAWAELNALSRAEVSQATGMLVAQLGVEPAEALVRLRAHAYATGRSATDVARDILDRRLKLESDRGQPIANETPTEEGNVTDTTRETRVLDAVVSLVDTLLVDFDVVDLLTELTERCAELLDVASAGFLLADPLKQLRLVAVTSEQARELELFQLQADEGPCVDCFVTGQPVSVANLQTETERWPRFVPAALDAGFASVHAVPMRAAGLVLGALGLFGTHPGVLSDADLLVGQTLTHIACVAILQERAPTPSTVMPQLHSALTRRVVVEQAKGFLRETLEVSVEQAFQLLRTYSRTHRRHLTEVARRLMTEPGSRPEILAAMSELAQG